MAGDTGPSIPGPAAFSDHNARNARLEALKIQQAGRRVARNRLPQLPDDPGKLNKIGQDAIEGTEKFFAGVGHGINDIILSRPDGPAMRELALSEEEYQREIEKYAEGLKQSKIKWQKEAGTIIHDILKLGDNAAELYEAFQEYPFSDNFKDYSKDKADAANKHDYRVGLINQAIALYYVDIIKKLEKLKITDNPKFRGAQHYLEKLKTKLHEKAALDKTVKECKTQAGLAQFSIRHSRKRNRESEAHSTFIEGLSDGIGRATYAWRLLKAGYVKDYSKQAEERAKELEDVLAHVEKHRQETEAKIDAYISQAQKRANALNDSTNRQGVVNGIIAGTAIRATNAGLRTAGTAIRVTNNPVGNIRHKNLADASLTVTAANINATIQNIRTHVTNLDIEYTNALQQITEAQTRAGEAQTRAEIAGKRAQKAEERAEIAKAYKETYKGIAITDEDIKAIKDVEESAKNIEILENQVVENARLIESKERNVADAISAIRGNLASIHDILLEESWRAWRVGRAVSFTNQEIDDLAKFANYTEKAEITKNSVINLQQNDVAAEEVALGKISDELQKELTALGQEHNSSATVIDGLGQQDLPQLQSFVANQRALEETLKGTPAIGPAIADPGLIEIERDESRIAGEIEEAIMVTRAANIAVDKQSEAANRLEIIRRRNAFETALRTLRNNEETVAEALKRNSIHMGQGITDDADQAINHLQWIKDDIALQDDQDLKKRSKGHLFIDPKAGKFTIGDEAIWMSIREIDGWEKPDPNLPGKTRAKFRPDIVKIEVETITREAKALSVEPVDTKRLSHRFFQSTDYKYLLEVPGASANTAVRRRYATLAITDLKKRDSKTPKPIDAQARATATTAAAFVLTSAGVEYPAAAAAARSIADALISGQPPTSTSAKAIETAVKSAQYADLASADPSFYSMVEAMLNGLSSSDNRSDSAAKHAAEQAFQAAIDNNPALAVQVQLTANTVGPIVTNCIMQAIFNAYGASEAVFEAGGAQAAATALSRDLSNLHTQGTPLPPGSFAAYQAFSGQSSTAVIALGSAASWSKAEYTETRLIPMEAAGKIKIRENHNNQSSPVEPIFISNVETMPNPVIDHAQALARRQGEGWTDDQKLHMWYIDLDRRMLGIPDGPEYSMDEIDWTETKWDEVNGLTLQYKGPRELSQINLLAAGSSAIFSEKLLDATAALKKKHRKHIESGIEWLKQATKSYDESKINEALGSLQNHEGIESYQSNMTKNELEKPPKNRLDLEKLRKKKKAERNARIPKWVAHYTESAAEMLGARRGYENEMKDRIQSIHTTNPLSATRVWKSYANPEKYSLLEHSSSAEKQGLRDEIRKANHLDKTVSFSLLEDPKRGTASWVKNAAPNGLELLREYNLYQNKQDFTNQTEQQNVEQYLQSIITEFATNPNIDPYYTNQWYLQQAMAAARDGAFLGKVVNGYYVSGASDFIRKLKQVDCPQSSDKSLAGLRQADEYHWVTYLHNALSEAERRGMPELLQGVLPAAQWMQEFRYSNLELAEKALYLDTSSDNAKKLLDDIYIIENPLSWSEPEFETEEKARVDTAKDKNPFDSKEIIKKSDGELAQAAVGIAGDQYEQVINRIESLLASVSDPALQKKFREAALQMTSEFYKNEQEIFKLAFAKRERLEALELWDKKQKQWWTRDLVEKLAFMWIQQGINAANKGVRDAESEFVKVLKKMLAV